MSELQQDLSVSSAANDGTVNSKDAVNLATEKFKKSVQLGEITPANIQQLRMLNINTLPVRYSDKFYNDILTTYASDYLRFAFCNGFVIGAVCARIENHPDHPEKKRLYIMTINVLAAYRRRGVGTLV